MIHLLHYFQMLTDFKKVSINKQPIINLGMQHLLPVAKYDSIGSVQEGT